MSIPTDRELRRAAHRVFAQLNYDRRVRWFVRMHGRWLPMTAVYSRAAGLRRCHTYRAQGALEVLGKQVRRLNRAKARRLQLRVIAQRTSRSPALPTT